MSAAAQIPEGKGEEQSKGRNRHLWTPREGHVDPSLPAWKRKYWEGVRQLKLQKEAERKGAPPAVHHSIFPQLTPTTRHLFRKLEI